MIDTMDVTFVERYFVCLATVCARQSAMFASHSGTPSMRSSRETDIEWFILAIHVVICLH